MIDNLFKAWPLIVLIATAIGLVIAWFATRSMRKATAAAQEQTIKVYQQTLAAKDTLALALAEERKDSDIRHEKVITEYRTNLHGVRGELQAATSKIGELRAELSEWRTRTDFVPVMEFLREEHKKSTDVQENILAVLAVIAPVLERVMQSLQMPSDSARKVEVINDPEHPVPVKQ